MVAKAQKPSVASASLILCILALEALAILHWVGVPQWYVFPAAGLVTVAAILSRRPALAMPLVNTK